jgi:hypothetical protein
VPTYDSGRLKDLSMLEGKLKKVTDYREKADIQRAIDAIKRQGENPQLAKEREILLNARRAATNAVGEINIKNARETADKIEERIQHTLGA